jgi:3-hydroxybutyrate dehydrogenase
MKKLAIITGGSSGIGLSILQALTQQNYNCVSWDIKPPAEGSSTEYIHCDVTQEEMVQKAYEKTKAQFGTPYLLVNNSGLQFLSPVEDFPLEKWNLIIGVLLTGTFLCSKAVIKDMKEKKEGRIIQISSIHGKIASPYKAAYVSAKHGVLGLTKVLAQELAEFNITVNAICPGFVDTPLMQGQVQEQMRLNKLSQEQVLKEIFLKQQNIKKLTQTSQISDMVLYLASESSSTITGEALNISGGWGMGL